MTMTPEQTAALKEILYDRITKEIESLSKKVDDHRNGKKGKDYLLGTVIRPTTLIEWFAEHASLVQKYGDDYDVHTIAKDMKEQRDAQLAQWALYRNKLPPTGEQIAFYALSELTDILHQFCEANPT